MSERFELPLLVLGLGNVLCGDDGTGAVAVHLLERRYRASEGVTLLDGGTLGLSLLPYLEQAERAILVDAIRAEAPPGTLVRLQGDEVAPAVAGRLPRQLVLLGLVPQSLELGVRRTPAVEAALSGLLEAVAGEAARLGYPFTARTDDELASRAAPDLALVYGV
jgi:hydrogenase maturation protease